MNKARTFWNICFLVRAGSAGHLPIATHRINHYFPDFAEKQTLIARQMFMVCSRV